MIASLVFLTPDAAYLALLALLPLGALAIAERRLRRARSLLRLREPGRAKLVRRALVLACIPLLIALALMQPALRHRGSVSVRADAAVFVVFDTSSSMSAAAGPRAPTRLAQAKSLAIAVDANLAGVPMGIATFTDRVLPNLFPTVDTAAFESTARSLTIASPPPREESRLATDFGVLAAVRRANFFSSSEKHRALLLLTDGESGPFDGVALARALARTPSVHVLVMRLGGAGDRFHTSDGRAGGAYRADPAAARRAVSHLLVATGGSQFSSVADVSAGLRSVLGPGTSTSVVGEPTTRSLAPWIAIGSIVPLLVLLSFSGTFRATRRVT
ncbi:MAG TPA: VWA domain-containing protein [Gaiellales bacterium]